MKITFKSGCGPVNLGKFVAAKEPMTSKKEQIENTHFAMDSSNCYKITKISLSGLFSQVKSETSTNATASSSKGTKLVRHSSRKSKRAKEKKEEEEKKFLSPEVIEVKFATSTPSTEKAKVKDSHTAAPKTTPEETTSTSSGSTRTIKLKEKITFGSKTFAEVAGHNFKTQEPVEQKRVHRRDKPKGRNRVEEGTPLDNSNENPQNPQKPQKSAGSQQAVTFWVHPFSPAVARIVSRPNLETSAKRRAGASVPPKLGRKFSINTSEKGSPMARARFSVTETKPFVGVQQEPPGISDETPGDEAVLRKNRAAAVWNAAGLEISQVIKLLRENPDIDQAKLINNRDLWAVADELNRVLNPGKKAPVVQDGQRTEKMPRKTQGSSSSATRSPKTPSVSPFALPANPQVAPKDSPEPTNTPVKQSPMLWSQALAPVNPTKQATKAAHLLTKDVSVKQKYPKKIQEAVQPVKKAIWETARSPKSSPDSPRSPKTPKPIETRKTKPRVNHEPYIDSDGFQMVRGRRSRTGVPLRTPQTSPAATAVVEIAKNLSPVRHLMNIPKPSKVNPPASPEIFKPFQNLLLFPQLERNLDRQCRRSAPSLGTSMAAKSSPVCVETCSAAAEGRSARKPKKARTVALQGKSWPAQGNASALIPPV